MKNLSTDGKFWERNPEKGRRGRSTPRGLKTLIKPLNSRIVSGRIARTRYYLTTIFGLFCISIVGSREFNREMGVCGESCWELALMIARDGVTT